MSKPQGWFLALLLLPSCRLWDRLPEPTPPPVQVAASYRAAPVDGHPLRRVVVLPFQDATGHPEQAEQVRQALIDELQKRQTFEVLALGPEALEAEEQEHFFQSGVVQQGTLVTLAQHHRADGVLYGAITRYRPYEPLVLGLQVTLVAAGAGDVVWTANGLFDAGDTRVAQDVHHYHDTRLTPTESLEGWRVILISPARFAVYACARLADTL